MKTVRLFSIVMAVVLFVTAFVPFAPAVAQSALAAASAPLQAFESASQGMPLLAPMSLGLPAISLSVSPASGSYACTFVSQSPKDWTRMRSRQYFDMVWTVKNSGNAVWIAKSTKLAYVSGTKMQTRGNSVALSSDVGRGKKVKFVVDMEAPKAKGTYSTLWAVYSGGTRFCKVTLSISVTR